MNTIAVDTLMAQTRRLAALYRQTTGQTLPISAELSRYDASKILSLSPLEGAPMAGVDFVGTGPYHCKNIQVKSRVIFNEGSSGYRIGQLNLNMAWDIVVLVLYDAVYEPFAIYAASKEEVLSSLTQSTQKQSRGAMSLAKFKAISQLIWTSQGGLDWGELWQNQSKMGF